MGAAPVDNDDWAAPRLPRPALYENSNLPQRGCEFEKATGQRLRALRPSLASALLLGGTKPLRASRSSFEVVSISGQPNSLGRCIFM